MFPIPSLAATCGAAGLGLNLFAVGILAGLGETIGEFSGYPIGYVGQSVISRIIYNKVHIWMDKWGNPILFMLAVIPNPVLILLAFMRVF